MPHVRPHRLSTIEPVDVKASFLVKERGKRGTALICRDPSAISLTSQRLPHSSKLITYTDTPLHR